MYIHYSRGDGCKNWAETDKSMQICMHACDTISNNFREGALYFHDSNYSFLLLFDKCHRIFMLFIEISFTVYAWDIILDHLLHSYTKQQLLGNNLLWISSIIQKITVFWIWLFQNRTSNHGESFSYSCIQDD